MFFFDKESCGPILLFQKEKLLIIDPREREMTLSRLNIGHLDSHHNEQKVSVLD